METYNRMDESQNNHAHWKKPIPLQECIYTKFIQNYILHLYKITFIQNSKKCKLI